MKMQVVKCTKINEFWEKFLVTLTNGNGSSSVTTLLRGNAKKTVM